ncbi:glutamate-ammonia-ligase adenylyltransferase [Roseivivax lentus]|uniref:Glutamate-ammonia-ligase adenylyltransferase n=1 Tax=Roseivivax lentus TaxID=633194 RepID=A0A1N7MXP0_9RHOB|nr:glutamine-synthetase adenylyltransferase [Roseivivax lentus]SIS90649.1 glutamate-ammonia-ligase adenylyltransferase [Roseivivax lentus]
MTFASRMTRCPRPFDADHGRDGRAAAPWADGAIADLIEGAAGSSPYLKSLVEKETDWLQTALNDPESALETLYSDLRDGAPDKRATDLRQGKRRIALLSGLADLAGVWPLETVTGTLSDFADLSVQLALEATIGAEIKRGKLPGATEDDIAAAGGMVALAMGKMGAGELNYSSDIDLICLFDEGRFDPDDYHEARASFIRATRKMSSMLSEMTGEGYVFRTDLRLRPDPAVTPVCMAMEAAERYYESVGRTWERAAYIKARPAAGDIAAGQQFLKTLTPFVWRRHLDFAAIQDAHDMRLRIRKHKGLGGPITLPGHNMKLGRGGIREIEFFTQTQQIIAGGRDPDLRLRGTVESLRVLAKKQWIPEALAATLTQNYRAHREVEHRVQMIHDAQTHLLPNSDEGFARLSCLMDMDIKTLQGDIHARLEETHAATEGFFRPDAGAASCPPDALDFGGDVLARWPTYPALRSARAVAIFDRLKPDILSRLQKAARPEEALVAFDGFLSGLPAGVQLFSLFEANPQLIDLLVDIVATSPDLARYLSRNAQVFDAVIVGDFFAEWPGCDALRAALDDVLAREGDYERCLDAARRWGKEWHFRAGVHLLRGLITPEEAAAQYADVAEASLAALWPIVVAEFSRRHGAPPGKGAVVLGMGSLGALRLHARSDLDVIVIYDADGVEESNGKKSLSARPYYARLTQALVAAITAPMAEGRLYEMDMRLRPSGNQGPVATAFSAFREYQQSQAWVWEHMALTRARPVAGDTDLGDAVEAFRRSLLSGRTTPEDGLRELAEMRARISAAKGTGSPWDPKVGRGRLQEIELLAQTGALLSEEVPRGTDEGLRAAAGAGLFPKADAEELCDTYRWLWALQIGARLVSDGPFDPETAGGGAVDFLLRLSGETSTDALAQHMAERTEAAGRIIDRALGQETAP